MNHEDGQVPKPTALDDLLGVSNTSMDVDPSSFSVEDLIQLGVYMRVHPLTW